MQIDTLNRIVLTTVLAAGTVGCRPNKEISSEITPIRIYEGNYEEQTIEIQRNLDIINLSENPIYSAILIPRNSELLSICDQNVVPQHSIALADGTEVNLYLISSDGQLVPGLKTEVGNSFFSIEVLTCGILTQDQAEIVRMMEWTNERLQEYLDGLTELIEEHNMQDNSIQG